MKAAAASFKAKHDRLHYLINNAAVMATPFATTVDGFEEQMAATHFGHFTLTGELMDKCVGARRGGAARGALRAAARRHVPCATAAVVARKRSAYEAPPAPTCVRPARRLRASAPSRVVTQSSMMHEYSGDIPFDGINAQRSAWCAHTHTLSHHSPRSLAAPAALPSRCPGAPAVTHARTLTCAAPCLDMRARPPLPPFRHRGIYANAKLANLLFTLELKKRLAAHAPGVLAVACHPGYTATGLQSTPGKGPAWLMGCCNSLFAQDVGMGAQPQLYAALGEDIDNGDYTGPVSKTKGAATKVAKAARACDEEAAEALWRVSAQLTGVDFLQGQA